MTIMQIMRYNFTNFKLYEEAHFYYLIKGKRKLFKYWKCLPKILYETSLHDNAHQQGPQAFVDAGR